MKLNEYLNKNIKSFDTEGCKYFVCTSEDKYLFIICRRADIDEAIHKNCSYFTDIKGYGDYKYNTSAHQIFEISFYIDVDHILHMSVNFLSGTAKSELEFLNYIQDYIKRNKGWGVDNIGYYNTITDDIINKYCKNYLKKTIK